MDSRLNDYHFTANANTVCVWTLMVSGIALVIVRVLTDDSDLGQLGLLVFMAGHFRGVSGMMHRLRRQERADMFDLSRDSAMIRTLERNAFELGKDAGRRGLRSVDDRTEHNGA